MEFASSQDAQRIVAAYLQVLDSHAQIDTYPNSVGDLPESKEIIRAAFRTCVTTLAAANQLQPEMSEYLEVAYVSLADYVTDECVALLKEYGQAGEELAGDRRLAREKLDTEAWRRLSAQSRLAGQVAREISVEADRLREEFRAWRAD